jgi:predicted deacetylase
MSGEGRLHVDATHRRFREARWLIISVHDVSPAHCREVRRLLALLDDLGARPRVLKVVPNEAGRGDLRQHPDLVELLRGEVQQGSELVLHGYRHRAPAPPRGPWTVWLRVRLFARSAAEFTALTNAEMLHRILAGRHILHAVGLDAQGFCAPGWLALPELPAVLRAAGLRYYISMGSVQDVLTGQRISTPWLGYMGADPLQEWLVGLAGHMTLELAPRLPVLKLFLHPQGAPTAPACRRTLQSLERLLQCRVPVTYEQLFTCCDTCYG